jgi:hypothetical protein
MQVKGLTDLITQPLWDTATAAAAGQTQLTYFSLPVGQGTTAFVGAGAKTFADTNMDLAGQLPSGFAFQVNGFRLLFKWDVVIADLQLILNGATFRFVVGQKDFLRVPARSLPSGSGIYFQGTTAATTIGATSGWPTLANNFGIKGKPLILNATENFAAFLVWQSGVQAISAIMPITVVLDGYLGRPVQ